MTSTLSYHDPYRDMMPTLLEAVRQRLGCSWSQLAKKLDYDYVSLCEVRRPDKRRKIPHRVWGRLVDLMIQESCTDIWRNLMTGYASGQAANPMSTEQQAVRALQTMRQTRKFSFSKRN